jgi:hypothetical protein
LWDNRKSRSEALGIEEVFLLCAIGPAQHQKVLNTTRLFTTRLFGEQVTSHFDARGPRAAFAATSA